MKLLVIATGSKGNSYALRSTTGETLIIDCGVHADEIKKAIDFQLSNVVGCIVSHEHNDHSKGINAMMGSGVDVYAAKQTHAALQTTSSHRAKEFEELHGCYLVHDIGSFEVLPFKVKHDVHCVGFLIRHKECGKVLFITDSYYCPHKFSDLNNIIVEANYSKEILEKKAHGDKFFLRNRIVKSHMSLETCIDLLKANDLSKVNNVVLIHLSDSNSDEKLYKEKVFEEIGKLPVIASNGLEMNFDEKPF